MASVSGVNTMTPPDPKLTPAFNAANSAQQDYLLVLTRPAADLAAQAEEFRARLERWLYLQGEDAKKTFSQLAAAPGEGNARVTLTCTEALMAHIERQFAGDILRVEPPAQHARGAVYPPKVDPFDVRFW
jgi:hypothetical protein